MSSFSASGLTNKGRALQAKAQAGAALVYTKAVAGDGTLGNQSIGPLTNVLSPKVTYELTRFKATGNMATIGFDITNQGLATGFYFREIGIFATDPDEGEILYWYANAGNTADYIPPGGGSDIIEKTFDVLVFVGTASNVSAVINSSNIYVTTETLDEAIQTAKGYTDTKFSQIIIQDASVTQKGVVQLSNSTTSTSQTLAGTANAVNLARQAAITAAATDATTKANTAETNAKNYADTNFRKPSEMLQANIIKNSTAAQGFNYWNAVSGPWNAYLNQYVGSYFAISGIAVSDVDYLLLENEAVGVSPGAQYLLQAVLHSGGSYANSRIYVEMYNPATGAPIDSVQADNQKWWHRKTKIVTIPAGVSAIKLRLVVNNVPANMTAGFSRIMLTEGTLDVPYSQEMDIRALYEQNEAVKQSGVDAKNGVVGAINAKGGSASTSDPWPTLVSKINGIQQGQYRRLDEPNITGGTYIDVPAGRTGQVSTDLLTFPAGTKLIYFTTENSNSFFSQNTNLDLADAAFALKDSNGVLWKIGASVGQQQSAGIYFGAYATTVDLAVEARSVGYSITKEAVRSGGDPKPANFNSSGPVTLVFAVFVNNATVTRQVHFKLQYTDIVSV